MGIESKCLFLEFDKEERLVVMEAAMLILEYPDLRMLLANKLDLGDDYLDVILHKIRSVLNG